MLEKTDLGSVREVFLCFLNCVPKQNKEFPFLISHPVFSSSVVFFNNVLYDITKGDTYLAAIDAYEATLGENEDFFGYYMRLSKPYRLEFLKFCKEFLSLKDFTACLSDAWVSLEFPSHNGGVPLATLVEWFKEADEAELMSVEERNVFEALPDVVTLYRGTELLGNTKALSWSLEIDTARWYASRWKGAGYVYKANINKSDVLAYFAADKEVVVDYRGLKNVVGESVKREASEAAAKNKKGVHNGKH